MRICGVRGTKTLSSPSKLGAPGLVSAASSSSSRIKIWSGRSSTASAVTSALPLHCSSMAAMRTSGSSWEGVSRESS